jgi:hypothetical protein
MLVALFMMYHDRVLDHPMPCFVRCENRVLECLRLGQYEGEKKR